MLIYESIDHVRMQMRNVWKYDVGDPLELLVYAMITVSGTDHGRGRRRECSDLGCEGIPTFLQLL